MSACHAGERRFESGRDRHYLKGIMKSFIFGFLFLFFPALVFIELIILKEPSSVWAQSSYIDTQLFAIGGSIVVGFIGGLFGMWVEEIEHSFK